jgi:2-methylisocitrate lyase-like PEP mutase family enzyme
MARNTQIKKAEKFLALHHDPKLLVLPNIWDPLGARLLEQIGYPAVATASMAVAYSLGYDDGQMVTFTAMLDVIKRIASAVTVPLTADIERGYAEDLEVLADNVREVIRAGAVGINLEDGTSETGPLYPIERQCERIRAARTGADLENMPLVINARIDVFLCDETSSHEEKETETIERAKAYLDAGADCIYPITVGDIDTLKKIRRETGALINVYATESTAPMRELEAIGISRLSLGPNLLKASLTKMRRVAIELQNYGSYSVFTEESMTSDEIRRYVSKEKMS